MFENIINFFKNISKKNRKQSQENSKDAAKERLHLVLMQDRANVSADFLELMKQEIIDVIKKYIEIDENEINVTLTNKENEDGTSGAPALYANIPILNIKNDARKISKNDIENQKMENKKEENNQEEKENKIPKDELKKDEEKNSEENKKENKAEDKEEYKNDNEDSKNVESKEETIENEDSQKVEEIVVEEVKS